MIGADFLTDPIFQSDFERRVD